MSANIELTEPVHKACKQASVDILTNQINQLRYKYLTYEKSPFKDYSVSFKLYGEKWGEPTELVDINYGIFLKQFEQKFELRGKLTFISSTTKVIAPMDYTFKMLGIYSLSADGFNVSLLTEQHQFLSDYDNKVIAKAEENNLHRFDDNSIKENGKSLYGLLRAVNKPSNSTGEIIKDHEVFWDFVRLTNTIRFQIGQMKLYRPYINNYLAEPMTLNGRQIYRYQPTTLEARYIMYASVLTQLFYNYWDRIGDCLAIHFPIKAKNVYFHWVIDQADSGIHSSSNYIWLKGFRDNQWKDLNTKRSEIVHLTEMNSQFFNKYIANSDNKAELEKLQIEKEGLLDYYIDHYNLAVEGFKKMCYLIDEST